jgi:hypothetical protein
VVGSSCARVLTLARLSLCAPPQDSRFRTVLDVLSQLPNTTYLAQGLKMLGQPMQNVTQILQGKESGEPSRGEARSAAHLMLIADCCRSLVSFSPH